MKYQQTGGGTQPSLVIDHSGTCDVCGAETQPTIYDTSIRLSLYYRTWAWVCQTCFDEHDGQLGVGRGQRYEVQNEPV